MLNFGSFYSLVYVILNGYNEKGYTVCKHYTPKLFIYIDKFKLTLMGYVTRVTW